ncbi:glycogenin 1 isoform X2 [Colletes latitarsis]|uniref:glycogenin 1 isoform X2 n=1 Tax=Colletes latitarsis TaxID=2605962 RepID=UPI004035C926
MGGYAWVTLATNDAYSLGALVLAHSLRRVGTKHELAVLVTPGVTETMREKLAAVFSLVTEVNVLDSKDEANLALLARPELGITFTKLHCWRLTLYDKCVFLDADTLVIRNCDELFEREELSAAPDVGWPDCFNSGVFVYKPSQQTFASITAFAANKGSFDGGDQGLLNMYFSDWAHKDISKHLPFIYNMCSTATYSYLPAFKQFGNDVRIIHFIGITKPWLQYFDTLTGIVQPPMESAHLQPLLQLWWNIFCEKVHPHLSPVMTTSTLAPIWHEFSPMPFRTHIPNSPPTYIDVQDKPQSDFYVETPDFSEFKDPWENYHVQSDLVFHRKEDNNETKQYYSTTDRSSSINMLSDTFNSVKSVHQTHYESPPEHNKEVLYEQQCSEYNTSHSHIQHHSNQEQSNQFIGESKQKHMFFHSDNTSILNVQSDYWQNQQNIENYVPVHSVQHYSNESQSHVDYQHSWGNSCKSVPEETKRHQHVNHQHTYQYPCNDNHELFPEETTQHEHAYQHSANNSNKSLPEETKQHQHHESYVNHQHSTQHQMYDNVTHHQATQYYEQNSQTFHSNEYNDFESKKQEPYNTNERKQATENNIIHQSNLFTKQNTEQGEDINITDERTNTLISTSPHPVSKPCTDIHNVATQSDLHVTEDSSNAGLAGALAQITLGEPRSAEQIALEEHMRKQSWEQGQIDYMGLDSFDNIWKKICQTLSLAPTRLPSPPKETQKSAKSTTDKTIESVESTESLGSVQPAESIDEVDKETAQATISHTEEQSLVNNVPITDNDNIVSKLSEEGGEFINTTSSSAEKNKNGQTVSEEIKDISEKSTTRFESESHDMIIDPFSTQSTTQTSPEKPAEEFSKSLLLRGVPRETTIPIVPCDLVQSCSIGEQKVESCNKDNVSFITPTEVLASTVTNLEITIDAQQIKQPDIRDEKHANELSTASEVLTVSPVPIQVAESVLQMEPKESVSDSQTVTEEVLSSTITPVHESNVLCFKTDLENKVQVNGSTSAIDSVPNKEKLSSDIIDTVDKLSESSTKSAEISQILPLVEQLQLGETSTLPLSMAESTETYTDTHLQVTESIQEIKESESCTKEITEPVQVKEIESCTKETMEQPVQQVKETVDSTKKTTEAMDQIKKTESCTKGTPKSSAECEVTKTSQLRENPVRPSRAKELNVSSKSVPETPQDLKSQEKATTKKVVKKTPEKSASETDPVETAEGDGTGKKVVKKVVKKVAKKSKLKPEEALDDGAEECSSHSKQKKTVKLVKKGTKTLQTPDIDTTVSETPSSSTSDTPVPPKRKVKATATKSVVKKSDVE